MYNVIIKQEKFKKDKFECEEIIKNDFEVGTTNLDLTLKQNQISNRTVLYNKYKIGVGIVAEDLLKIKGKIKLELELPCTAQDISDFIKLIKRSCSLFEVNEFNLPMQKIDLKDIKTVEQSIKEENEKTIKELLNSIENADDSFLLQLVRWPILIGEKEKEQINSKENGFDLFIYEKQEKDANHSLPEIRRGMNGNYVLYEINDDENIIIANKENNILDLNVPIYEWYIQIKSNDNEINAIVKYDDFINAVNIKEYDTANIFINKLNKQELEAIVNNYKIDEEV